MDQQAVTNHVEKLLTQLNLELDRIEFRKTGNKQLVRICVDGDGIEGRGPSLDEIADATKIISASLDELPETGDRPYLLEVSSRGVSAPLTQPKHYRRNIGRLVKITLNDESLPPVLGRISACSDVDVTLDNDSTLISYDNVKTAVIQVELK